MHHGGAELYNTLELDDRKPFQLHWIVAWSRRARVRASLAHYLDSQDEPIAMGEADLQPVTQ